MKGMIAHIIEGVFGYEALVLLAGQSGTLLHALYRYFIIKTALGFDRKDNSY